MKKILLLVLIVLTIKFNALSQSFTYGFESGMDGWICDFADYNIGDSLTYQLFWTRDTLPVSPLNQGIILNGQNLSDNLFFFCKTHVAGLLPNTTYNIAYTTILVTRDNFSGIGGSDLMFKAGATLNEPLKYADISSGLMLMNIDKGDQAIPGRDMDTLGLVRHNFPDTNYHMIALDNSTHLFSFTTNSNGDAWLIVGAESMFEVFAEFLIAEIQVDFINTTIINEPPFINYSSMFPNPASDKLILNPNISLPAEIIAFDVSGKKIFSSEVKNQTVDISGLAEGTYYVTLISNGIKYFNNIVVIK